MRRSRSFVKGYRRRKGKVRAHVRSRRLKRVAVYDQRTGTLTTFNILRGQGAASPGMKAGMPGGPGKSLNTFDVGQAFTKQTVRPSLTSTVKIEPTKNTFGTRKTLIVDENGKIRGIH